MTKAELSALVRKYGDAVITYRSQNSKRLKYNICTLDFSTPYIQNKRNRAKETDNTLLLFCWDTDAYRLLDPSSVTGVTPLAAILKNDQV